MVKNTTMCIQGNQNTTLLAVQLKKLSEQYPILTKEQERKLIEENIGNREKLNELLVLHNLRMVLNIAKKYKTKTADFDGIVQDGFVGLGEAAKRFDPKRGTKFATSAYIWIKKYVLSSFYAKNVEVDKLSISLNDIAKAGPKSSTRDAEVADFVDSIADPTCQHSKTIEELIDQSEASEICSNMMQKIQQDTSLSATDKLVFVDIFYNGEKTRDIADKYALTMAEVRDIKSRMLDKCRDILACDYDVKAYGEL